MKYVLNPTKHFLQDVEKLSKNTNKLITKKLLLIKTNPFRNKSLKGFKIRLFRIRINDNNTEKRIIYTITHDEVILIAIIKRKHNYRDLEKILEKLNLI